MRGDWGHPTIFMPIGGRWHMHSKSKSSLDRYRNVTWFWRSSEDWSEIPEGSSGLIGADLISLGSWP